MLNCFFLFFFRSPLILLHCCDFHFSSCPKRLVEAFGICLNTRDTASGEPDIRNRLRRPQDDGKQELPPERQEQGDAGTNTTDDSRTLCVDVDSHGLQYNDFRQWVSESYQLGHDLDGPMVALDFARHVQRNGDHACGWWSQGKQHKRIDDGGRVNFAAVRLIEIIQASAEFDQLKAGGCLFMEMACRRLVAIAEAHEVASRPKLDTGRGSSRIRGLRTMLCRPQCVNSSNDESVRAWSSSRCWDHVNERCSARWRGSHRTISPAAFTGCKIPGQSQPFPHTWCRRLVDLATYGWYRKPGVRGGRATAVEEAVRGLNSLSRPAVECPPSSCSSTLQEVMCDIRTLARNASLTREPGHEKADVALRELLRRHSTCDVDVGPHPAHLLHLSRIL